jgi:hypothetical protein
MLGKIWAWGLLFFIAWVGFHQLQVEELLLWLVTTEAKK